MLPRPLTRILALLLAIQMVELPIAEASTVTRLPSAACSGSFELLNRDALAVRAWPFARFRLSGKPGRDGTAKTVVSLSRRKLLTAAFAMAVSPQQPSVPHSWLVQNRLAFPTPDPTLARVPPEVKADIDFFVEEVRNFQEGALAQLLALSAANPGPQNLSVPAFDEQFRIFYSRVMNRVTQKALVTMQHNGWMTPVLAERYQELSNPQYTGNRANFYLRAFLPAYFAHYGLEFYPSQVAYRGLTIPAWELRPVLAIEDRRDELPALSAPVSYRLITSGRSLLRTPREFNAALMGSRPASTAPASDEIFWRPDAGEAMVNGFVGDYHALVRDQPVLRAGGYLSPAQGGSGMTRGTINLYFRVLRRLASARGVALTDETVRSLLTDAVSRLILRHELVHVYDNAREATPVESTLEVMRKEARAAAASAMGSPEADLAAFIVLRSALDFSSRSEASNVVGHGQDLVYLRDALADALYHDAAVRAEAGIQVPEGLSESVVRDQMLDGLGALNADQLSRLFERVWGDLSRPANPLVPGEVPFSRPTGLRRWIGGAITSALVAGILFVLWRKRNPPAGPSADAPSKKRSVSKKKKKKSEDGRLGLFFLALLGAPKLSRAVETPSTINPDRVVAAASLRPSLPTVKVQQDSVQPSLPIVRSFRELAQVNKQSVPGPNRFRAYQLAGGLPIVFFHFANAEAQMDVLARVIAWYDIGHMSGIKLNSLEEAKEIIAKAVGSDGQIGGSNYTAEQIVSVFNAYLSSHYALNVREEQWVNEMIRLGFIKREGELLAAAKPASFISSYQGMEATVLVHELTHALVDQSPTYHEEIVKLWASISTDEQAEFKRLITATGYNVEDQAVVISEFAAYGSDDFAGLDTEKTSIASTRLQGWGAIIRSQAHAVFPFLDGAYQQPLSTEQRQFRQAA